MVLCKAQSLIELMRLTVGVVLHIQLTPYIKTFSQSTNVTEINNFSVTASDCEFSSNSGRLDQLEVFH